ncbi:MAG: glycosyltransferase family 2 protein [Bdellovibrionales bacterium]|nr:glycosyltransferase family 2 protein [Bdellovibrionales bacterium]
MLSVVIICKNEEEKIRKCLESVRFADEIVVFDSGSTDRTVEICREYTSKVFVTDWPGFGPQKQRALEEAKGDWVLSIDADEIVTEKLKEEILLAIESHQFSSYFLPRLSFYLGQPIRYGGWYPDYLVRLFQKSQGRFSADIVHEKVLVEGQAGYLTQALHHFPYDSLEQVIEKFNHYSSLGAEKLAAKNNRKSGLSVALFRAVFAFMRMYVLKKGFLDGRMGFIIAITSAETAYYKYLKLYLLQRNQLNERRGS